MPGAASFQAVFLQATIHGAAAQTERFGSLADIAIVTSQRALDEVMLDFVEAHVFEAGIGADGGRAEAEIGGADRGSGGEEDAALDSVIEFADVAGPGMLVQELHGHRIETGDVFAIALGVAAEEMMREEIDIFFALAQRREMDLDGVQAEKEILAEA